MNWSVFFMTLLFAATLGTAKGAIVILDEAWEVWEFALGMILAAAAIIMGAVFLGILFK